MRKSGLLPRISRRSSWARPTAGDEGRGFAFDGEESNAALVSAFEAIIDPDNPYRYVQIRGRVRRVTEDGAAQHIDSLAKKYLGKDKYPNAQPGEVRLLCEIEPTSASGMG